MLIYFLSRFDRFQPQRAFTPPPPIGGPPQMHPQQRQPSQPGAGFSNVRGANPNTPSGKRPQDARNQMAAGPPKG